MAWGVETIEPLFFSGAFWDSGPRDLHGFTRTSPLYRRCTSTSTLNYDYMESQLHRVGDDQICDAATGPSIRISGAAGSGKFANNPALPHAPLEPHPKTTRAPNKHHQGAWQGHPAASSADLKSAASPSTSRVSERLLRLSERSAEALSLLPNRGRPVVGRDGLLREYRGVDTSELPDPGHRHWSGLWSLYPGSQVSGIQRRGAGGGVCWDDGLP